MSSYDVVVVGRGPLGSSAAGHIADLGVKVCLVGPPEPANRGEHRGVFGSHYDSARITRIVDRDPYYSAIAAASIARYSALEMRSSIRFFHPVGHLAVSPMADYMAALRVQAELHDLDHEVLDDAGLAARFPMFRFQPGMEAVLERRTAGWIDPREYIEAQSSVVRLAGGDVVGDTVVGLRAESQGASITTSSGLELGAEKVLLATGAFANELGIIPVPVRFEVERHTVVLAEIDDPRQLEDMPSVIYKRGSEVGESVYLLPPVRYPDGGTYVKIGQSRGDLMADPQAELVPWFQGVGDPDIADWLEAELRSLAPDVGLSSLRTESCVVTKSPSHRQFIDRFPGTTVYSLLADDGQVAKSADELGRIAAHRVLHGEVPREYRDVDYSMRVVSR